MLPRAPHSRPVLLRFAIPPPPHILGFVLAFPHLPRAVFDPAPLQEKALAQVILPAFAKELTARLQTVYGARVLVAAASLQGSGVETAATHTTTGGRNTGVVTAEYLLSRGSTKLGYPRARVAQAAWRFRRAQAEASRNGKDSSSGDSDSSSFVLTQHCKASVRELGVGGAQSRPSLWLVFDNCSDLSLSPYPVVNLTTL